MNKAITLFFVLALVSILAACELFPDYAVTINGTVTITRDGIPWALDIIPSSPSTGPARNCPYDTEHDTVKEVIFPSHPSIDLKAFNISGTLLLNAPQKILYPLSVYFDAESSGKGISYRTKVEKYKPQPDVNGLIHWETMLPAFSFPHNLPCIISATLLKGNDSISGKVTPSSVVITITEDTDLNNIHLGSFTVE